MTDVESEILSWEPIGFDENNDKEIKDKVEVMNLEIENLNLLLKDKEDKITSMRDTISDFYKTINEMYSNAEELKKQLDFKDMVIKQLSDRFAEKINNYEEIIHEKDKKIKSLETLVESSTITHGFTPLSNFQSYNYNDMITSKYIPHDFCDHYTLGIF